MTSTAEQEIQLERTVKNEAIIGLNFGPRLFMNKPKSFFPLNLI